MTAAGTVRALAAIALSIGLPAWLAPVAAAEFGPIRLVSKSAFEQATFAQVPALSGNGRYVAFAGQLGGREGIFRKDLTSGEIVLVLAENRIVETNPAPSISADGRYVAFTTKLQLDPGDDLGAETADVYVADLSTAPPTYELASARDGCRPGTGESPCGLGYGSAEGYPAVLGSLAAGRVALSADGRRVAFITRVPSDLAGPETPPGQVAVRDLGTDRTYLISVARGGASPVAGGGADERSDGAAISADGTTVAWVGRHLPEQVPMLAQEAGEVEALESEPRIEPSEREGREYHEPLWRRVPSALEPDPVTRRVVGGGDPLAVGCPAGGSPSEPACQGPFVELAKPREFSSDEATYGRGWGTKVPRLSADGSVVAVVGNPDEDYDLFAVDMRPGLSRKQAVRRVTQWINFYSGDPGKSVTGGKLTPYGGPLADCEISPNGNLLAFTTARQVFPLAPPTLVSPLPPGPSELNEIYQADLAGGTIERVTPGGGGTVSLGGAATASGGAPTGAAAPSYDASGRLLAFASDAFNIVGGDANSAPDVFTVESDPPRPISPSTISPEPPRRVTRARRLTVHASSRPDGSVALVVGVPGAGRVLVRAAAPIGPQLRTRRVATARRRARQGSVLRMRLRLAPRLRRLARREDGLAARLRVTFAAAGGNPQRARLGARFRVHARKGKR